MENLFHSQTDKSHHTHRNFGDWIMQQPQINIYEKKKLDKKKIRRTSEYTCA